jgi:hypothetical protein
MAFTSVFNLDTKARQYKFVLSKHYSHILINLTTTTATVEFSLKFYLVLQ